MKNINQNINQNEEIYLSPAEKRKFGTVSKRASIQQIQKYNQKLVNYDTELSRRNQQDERMRAIEYIAQEAKQKAEQKKKQQLLQQALQTKSNPISLMGATGTTLTGLSIAGWFLT